MSLRGMPRPSARYSLLFSHDRVDFAMGRTAFLLLFYVRRAVQKHKKALWAARGAKIAISSHLGSFRPLCCRFRPILCNFTATALHDFSNVCTFAP